MAVTEKQMLRWFPDHKRLIKMYLKGFKEVHNVKGPLDSRMCFVFLRWIDTQAYVPQQLRDALNFGTSLNDKQIQKRILEKLAD